MYDQTTADLIRENARLKRENAALRDEASDVVLDILEGNERLAATVVALREKFQEIVAIGERMNIESSQPRWIIMTLVARYALASTTAGDDLLAQLAEARKDTERVAAGVRTVQQWVEAAESGKLSWGNRDIIQMPLSTWKRLTHSINLLDLATPAISQTESKEEKA